jgi:hypothetical protein
MWLCKQQRQNGNLDFLRPAPNPFFSYDFIVRWNESKVLKREPKHWRKLYYEKKNLNATRAPIAA